MSDIGLLRSRRFSPLFWTQFLGAFNDNFLKNALIILITYKSARVFGMSPQDMVPLAGGLLILPFFIFSATAGQLADKLEKSRLIKFIKVAEVGIMCLATAGFLTEKFELLLVALFLMGLHSTFFGPIKYSILPQHLGTSELVGGNALIEAGTFLAILLGTLAGGVLISRSGGPALVSGTLIVMALAGLIASVFIPKAAPVDATLKVQWNPIPPTLEIYKFTRQTRSVYLSILGISWFWFFGSAVLLTLPEYCKDVLQADEAVVTTFLAIFCVGSGLGSLLCERLSRQRLELGLVPLGSLGISVFSIMLFAVGDGGYPSIAGIATGGTGLIGLNAFFSRAAGREIAAALFLLSVFSGLFIVPLYTLVQERTAPSHRSRVIAGNNVLNALFMVIASVLLIVLKRAGLSVPQIFLTLALMNLAVSVYIYSILPEFMLRFYMWMLANILYRLKVTGHEKIPKEGAAILVCNHITFIDWMIISAAVKRPIRFIMDHAYYKNIMWRWLLVQGKVIPIATAKEDPAILERAFERAAAELREGELLCIFPEGKLTRTGEMNVFKPGVERLIRETPVPVVPMALKGMWGSLFSREGNRPFLKPPRKLWAKIELQISEPVAPSEVNARMLFDKVAAMRGNRQ